MSDTPKRLSTAQPRFLQINGRKLFALEILPTGPCTHSMLYLPPLAEEMNRCRSHVTALARALATHGVRTLLLDHYGTGESEGRIEDSDWEIWLDDAEAVAHLLLVSHQALTLWGARTGALLAAELADTLGDQIERLFFWQPVLDGKQFMGQYLRLRMASQLVGNAERETTEQMRQRLASGETLEIAGYPLTGKLSDQIASRRLSAFASMTKLHIVWLEMGGQGGKGLSPASQQLCEKMRLAGAHIEAEAILCPQIWQLHERADAPELQRASLRLLGYA